MVYDMLHAFAGVSGAIGVSFGYVYIGLYPCTLTDVGLCSAIGAHALKNRLNASRTLFAIVLFF